MVAKRPLKRATNTGRTQPDTSPADDVDEDELENLDDEPTTDKPTEDDEDKGGGNPNETGEDPNPDNPQLRLAAEEAPEHIPGAPQDGRTYAAGQPVVFKGEKRGGTIVAMENVYRATKHPTSSRWRFHQLLVKGSELPSTKVKELTKGEYESDQI